MTAIEQADEYRLKAIDLLLSEREQIENRLNQLGYGQEQKSPDKKRRGRPPKQQPDLELSSDHSERTESVAP
jgi:hypothetical protein